MIGIVVLNYNSWEDTYKCICSIFNSDNSDDIHIYLVDNNSSTQMPIKIKNIINNKKITYISVESNRGYSAGNNYGIFAALRDGMNNIVISNSDILYSNNSIQKMNEYLISDLAVGMIGPKIILNNGELQTINMGLETTLKNRYKYILSKTPLKFMFKKFLNKYHAREKNMAKPFEIYSLSGCCIMFSNSFIKKIYPLDENVFLYNEELILGDKCSKYGFKAIYYPLTEVVHTHKQIKGPISPNLYIAFIKSELYYFHNVQKNNLFLILPLLSIRIIKYLFISVYNRKYRKSIWLLFKKKG